MLSSVKLQSGQIFLDHTSKFAERSAQFPCLFRSELALSGQKEAAVLDHSR